MMNCELLNKSYNLLLIPINSVTKGIGLSSILTYSYLFINHQTINIMKKVSLLLVAAALLISSNALAFEGESSPKDPESEICTQISDLLRKNRFELQSKGDLTAFVRFTLNGENEIVVLSVETEDDRLEGYVKARLNYHKLGDQDFEEGKLYHLPIRIKA